MREFINAVLAAHFVAAREGGSTGGRRPSTSDCESSQVTLNWGVACSPSDDYGREAL
jgi:hypothetical protein